MDIAVYAAEARVEEQHWWFVGRRLIFSDIIAEFGLPCSAAILDVGTGTGTNLRMLRDLGFDHVIGLDPSPEAIRFCAEKGFGGVQPGDVCALPFADGQFDLVLATDVIEHVDDDLAALRGIRRALVPGGRLLLTVPAFSLLWGQQDEAGHHKRRYRLPELLDRVCAAGLLPVQDFYFNYLLFLPILGARRIMRMIKLPLTSETELNTEWLNRLMTSFFKFDVRTARRLRPPFGVSALVVAKRI